MIASITKYLKAKTLMLSMAVMLLSQFVIAQPEWKDVVLKNGKRFGLSAYAQTVQFYIQDSITGDKVLKTEELGKTPLTVDGEKIYTAREVKTNKPELDLWHYLGLQIIIKLQHSKLPKGNGWFYLHNIVIDKEGKIIYCDIEGQKFEDTDGIVRSFSLPSTDTIIANAPRVVAQVAGKPVYAIVGTGEGKFTFNIQFNHLSDGEKK